MKIWKTRDGEWITLSDFIRRWKEGMEQSEEYKKLNDNKMRLPE